MKLNEMAIKSIIAECCTIYGEREMDQAIEQKKIYIYSIYGANEKQNESVSERQNFQH